MSAAMAVIAKGLRAAKDILTKSGWVKEASVDFKMPEGGFGGARGGGGGMGGPGGGGGMGGGGGGARGGGGGGMGSPGGGGGMGGGGGERPQMKATIRWESAAPIREALGKKEAGDAEKFYIVSMSGMGGMGGPGGRRGQAGPPPGNQLLAQAGQGGQRPQLSPEDMQQRTQQMAAQMKEATKLERKGKDAIGCDKIDVQRTETGQVTYFFFSRAGEPIKASDKDVTFVTRRGPMEIKAKFTLKDMMSGGKLEL